jgi:hypothetical protein
VAIPVGHCLQLCDPGAEDRPPFDIHGVPFLGAHDQRLDVLAGERQTVQKSAVEQAEQTGEALGLPRVRGSRQQQDPAAGSRKLPAQAVTRHFIAGSTDVMCLVNDGQVPASSHQRLEPLLVVLGDPPGRPACSHPNRLHGVQRAHHLVKGTPRVHSGTHRDSSRSHQHELLTEAVCQLADP